MARADRKMIVEGVIKGIYMRYNRTLTFPMDERSLQTIVDEIAPNYITMSQYDYEVLKAAVKDACALEKLSKEKKKTLRDLMKKISLFNER